MNTNQNVSSTPNRVAFIPLVSAEIFNTLPLELKTSYQRFCLERIQDLHPSKVIIPAGLGTFYTELLANLDMSLTAVHFVEPSARGDVATNVDNTIARALPATEPQNACRVVYLERNPNIPDYAWLLDDAKHLVTFSDGSDNTELFDVAISRGLDITNLYIPSIVNMASVHPAHCDTASSLETAGV